MSCYGCKYYMPPYDLSDIWCEWAWGPPYPCDFNDDDREPEQDDLLSPDLEPLNGL